MKTHKPKHTPLPWNVDRIGNRGEFLVTGENRKIAKNAVCGGSLSDISEDRANMELIAVAVNSHAALLDVAESASQMECVKPDSCLHCDAVKAIVLAEGRE